MSNDRGSASIWVLGGCALVVLLGYVAVLQATAVLARHRAESAADLAALAGAAGIGLGGDPCAAARRVARADAATVTSCVASVAADGRSGSVLVRVRLAARLAFVGVAQVSTSARAGRMGATEARRSSWTKRSTAEPVRPGRHRPIRFRPGARIDAP